MLGIGFGAVETADNRLANAGRFDWILFVDEALGQSGQLATAQFSLGITLVNQPDSGGLLFGRETFDFIDDLGGGHCSIMRERSRIAVRPRLTAIRSARVRSDAHIARKVPQRPESR